MTPSVLNKFDFVNARFLSLLILSFCIQFYYSFNSAALICMYVDTQKDGNLNVCIHSI